MFLDLDHFKEINDSLGHSAGDQCLQAVASLLEGCVRQSDTVSRHGGDEFVVLLSEIEAAPDAVHAAEKVIAALAAPSHDGDKLCNVTVSIGISVYPDDGSDAESVLKNADTAMYHAKRAGRNSYKRFSPENERPLRRAEIALKCRCPSGWVGPRFTSGSPAIRVDSKNVPRRSPREPACCTGIPAFGRNPARVIVSIAPRFRRLRPPR